MKILQIIDKLDVGGAERVLVNQANLLFENGVDVSVLCLLQASDLDGELNKKIDVRYLERKNKFDFKKVLQLYKLTQKFDILHVHSRHVLRYVGLLLYLPKSLVKFKVIYQDHSLLDFGVGFKNKRYLDYLLKKVDAVIVVSEEQRQFFPKGTSIFLLENMVRPINSRMNFPPSSKKLVAVGNFRRIKNYSFLLKILESLPEEYSLDIYANIIDQTYFNEHREILEFLIIRKRLNIIQGEFNIQKKLVDYSLAIHTSLSETGPLFAVECLSVGLPILMYHTGAVAKHIKDKTPELIMENINNSVWVESIIAYHADLKKIEAQSTILYELYLNAFGETKYFRNCLKIYQCTLNS